MYEIPTIHKKKLLQKNYLPRSVQDMKAGIGIAHNGMISSLRLNMQQCNNTTGGVSGNQGGP